MKLNLLETAIPLPASEVTDVRQYPLPGAMITGTDGVVAELENRDIIKRAHSSYNSLV